MFPYWAAAKIPTSIGEENDPGITMHSVPVVVLCKSYLKLFILNIYITYYRIYIITWIEKDFIVCLFVCLFVFMCPRAPLKIFMLSFRTSYGNKYSHIQKVTRDMQSDFVVSSRLLIRRCFKFFAFCIMYVIGIG